MNEHAENELEQVSPGTTMALTQEGWEASDYVDPADDWTPMDDGSYRSPDGSLRTWPLVNPTPD